VELAEGILFSLGFSDFRVRVSKNRASIVLREEEVSLYHRFEEKITEEFLNLFDEVELSPIRRR
jgi:PP-loop superfamily ATP-utilizing enzyme